MKKISKKLTLNKKSIVRLNDDEAGQIIGGGTQTCNTCPQYCDCDDPPPSHTCPPPTDTCQNVCATPFCGTTNQGGNYC